ncbi:MAG: molybdopterin dehydrogenase [Deltaproteobacteria bacterium]|nr:MAG: molybdopterin dehydrogenase [Deltaproteobacteria bacterium]
MHPAGIGVHRQRRPRRHRLAAHRTAHPARPDPGGAVVITFPKTVAAAATGARSARVRAGGTDLQELRSTGVVAGDIVDLRDVPGLGGIAEDGVELHVGARVTIAALAVHPVVTQRMPGLAQAAAGLATPQIRSRGTVAGNLLQQVRCWYYRNPHLQCAKKGGATCLARQGDHLFHVAWDNGLCAAPHPSTLAVALQAYDAQVELDDGSRLDIPALLGDGSDPRQTHALPAGRIVTAVHVPLVEEGEHGAYGRAIARARAEWPLIEVVARLRLDRRNRVQEARVVAGAMANRPRELSAVAEALLGQEARDEVLLAAAALAREGARPLPATGYKVKLVAGIVADVLTRARDGAGQEAE